MNEARILVEQIVKRLPKNAIKNGQLDEKLIEVVIRRSDGKISSMVKCALDNGGKDKILSKVIQNVPVGAISGVGTISSLANNVQTEMVRKEVKKLGKDVKEVLELTKNMSANIDKIAQGMSVVQSLSILNVALSAANIGVSVAGFTIMSKKLDAVGSELYKIHEIVSELKDMRIKEIINEGHELVDQTKGFYQRIDFKEASSKDYEYILGKYRSYVRNLRDMILCGHIDFQQGYSIIMGLLPAYIELLKKYVIEVFYAKRIFPQIEYDTHIKVIYSLADKEFLDMLFDFAYIEKQVSKLDSETAQGIHLLTVGNAYADAEDTRNLVLALPEKKNYMALERAIAEESKRRLLAAFPEKIDGLDYNRKEILKEIEELQLA